MSFSIRQLRPGDVLDFPILPEWESGTAEELDRDLTENGRGTAILRDGEVVGAIWYDPDADGNIKVIGAWKYRPTKELVIFVREMIAIVHHCTPGRELYTISKSGPASDRWHKFIGLSESVIIDQDNTQYSTGGTQCQKQ